MTAEPPPVTLREEPGGWVLTLPSRLDAPVEDSLVSAVERALESHARLLVLDFAGVTYASSAGIGAVVDTVRRAGARGAKVALASLQDQPRLVIERIGLTAHARAYDSVQGALRAEGSL